jgi:hypothetical protein
MLYSAFAPQSFSDARVQCTQMKRPALCPPIALPVKTSRRFRLESIALSGLFAVGGLLLVLWLFSTNIR